MTRSACVLSAAGSGVPVATDSCARTAIMIDIARERSLKRLIRLPLNYKLVATFHQ